MDDCPQQFSSLSPVVRYFFAFINVIACFVAFTGNLMVFILVWRTTSLRNRSICCIISLAVTDFLVGLILEPMHIIQFLSEEVGRNCTFNSIRRVFAVVLIGASISSIAFVSYDRYLHVSKTKNYTQNMSLRKVAGLIFIVWFIPVAMPFLLVLGNNETVYGTMILFYSPAMFIIMLVCYIYIIKIVKLQEQKMLGHAEFKNRRIARGTRYHIQAAKVVLIIIVSFFVTTMPISVYMGMSGIQLILGQEEISGFTGESREIFYAFAMTSAMISSAINPIVYYARNPGFKEGLMGMLNDTFPCLFKSKMSASAEDLQGDELSSCDAKTPVTVQKSDEQV